MIKNNFHINSFANAILISDFISNEWWYFFLDDDDDDIINPSYIKIDIYKDIFNGRYTTMFIFICLNLNSYRSNTFFIPI